jgi:hypothetical protein
MIRISTFLAVLLLAASLALPALAQGRGQGKGGVLFLPGGGLLSGGNATAGGGAQFYERGRLLQGYGGNDRAGGGVLFDQFGTPTAGGGLLDGTAGGGSAVAGFGRAGQQGGNRFVPGLSGGPGQSAPVILLRRRGKGLGRGILPGKGRGRP